MFLLLALYKSNSVYCGSIFCAMSIKILTLFNENVKYASNGKRPMLYFR